MTLYHSHREIVGLGISDVNLSRKIGAVRRRGVPLSAPAEALLASRERLVEI